MHRQLGAVVALLLTQGCLDRRPYTALGYRCSASEQCDEATVCVDTVCLPPAAAERPGVENTGVPDGTVLTPRTGVITVTTDGAVIDAVDLDGCIEVDANDVTIRRSRLRCGGDIGIRIAAGRVGTVVEDTEIIGHDWAQGSGIGFEAYTATRLEIRGYGRGALVGSNTVVEHCFIHALFGADRKAIDSSGATGLVLRRNQLDASGDDTGTAIYFHTLTDKIRQVQVINNWIDAGKNGVVVYGAADGAYDIVLENNRFGRSFKQALIVSGVPLGLMGNVYNDDGQPIPPPVAPP